MGMIYRTDKIVPVILVKNDEYWLPYCLQAVKEYFNRYVFYDVGSTDATKDIIEIFASSIGDEADIITRFLPHCEPIVQGTFRNALIAEARSDWYLILDADELWPQKGLARMIEQMDDMKREYEENGKIYGIVRRLEVARRLDALHGMEEKIPHHRVYHRTATWKGTHPGEDPRVTQKPRNEMWFDDEVKLLHFHQPDRSTLDEEVPSRLNRRFKATYLKGKSKPVDLLKVMPSLQKPVGPFPVNPILRKLQQEYANDT